MIAFIHWFMHAIGADNLSGPQYGFWSGFGSDIGEFPILGAIFMLYKHHKCAACWRIAHHKVEGTHYKTCHKHLTVHDHDLLYQKHHKKYPRQHLMLDQRR